MFCRSAVEAASANIVRRRAAERGTSLDEADEQIEEARTLRETLALVLFGDAGRQGEVAGEVKRRYGAGAAGLVSELNRGSHGAVLDEGTLKRLPESRTMLGSKPFGRTIELVDLDGDGIDDIVAATNLGAKAFLTRPGEPYRFEDVSGGLPNPAIGNSIYAVRAARFVTGGWPQIAVCTRVWSGVKPTSSTTPLRNAARTPVSPIPSRTSLMNSSVSRSGPSNRVPGPR